MKKKTVRKSYQCRLKSIELYSRIEEAMKDPVVYSDPKLSRKSLADRLYTNEAYVREAIMDHTNLTFSGYITGIRLAYARELLLCRYHIYPIQEIVYKCGFGSLSTFYRLFKSDCGMTPEEYRNHMYNLNDKNLLFANI